MFGWLWKFKDRPNLRWLVSERRPLSNFRAINDFLHRCVFAVQLFVFKFQLLLFFSEPDDVSCKFADFVLMTRLYRFYWLQLILCPFEFLFVVHENLFKLWDLLLVRRAHSFIHLSLVIVALLMLSQLVLEHLNLWLVICLHLAGYRVMLLLHC